MDQPNQPSEFVISA
uniref:Uncharacterized protein n=1 Tax=Rhizophora mucronata TaxID=61149 RepID=A0A2P2MDR3_RHIMU